MACLTGLTAFLSANSIGYGQPSRFGQQGSTTKIRSTRFPHENPRTFVRFSPTLEIVP
jgi:hypothetical protein